MPAASPNAADPALPTEPTIVLIWAPSCAACRAMRPDLEAVAAENANVRFVEINAAEDPDSVRSLRAMATPTLVALRDGVEIGRAIGRRTPSELRELFDAVESGRVPDRLGRHDSIIRASTGLALLAVGIATGPIWPLIAIGGGVATWGVIPWIRHQT